MEAAFGPWGCVIGGDREGLARFRSIRRGTLHLNCHRLARVVVADAGQAYRVDVVAATHLDDLVSLTETRPIGRRVFPDRGDALEGHTKPEINEIRGWERDVEPVQDLAGGILGPSRRSIT